MLRYAESKCNEGADVHSTYNTLMQQWWDTISLMLQVITTIMMEHVADIMGRA